MSKVITPLEELNLMDSILFTYSTEDNKNAELFAKVIISRVTGYTIDKVLVETEKELQGINIGKRGIRMDICVSEKLGGKVAKVYDIEPNKYEEKELCRRNRFYQAVIDSKLLNSGEDFKDLPDFISIWILPYDPFGRNRMIYSVRNVVTEEPDVLYNDGVMKLFLYAGGEKGGSKELKDFLKFFVMTNEENAVDDELIQLKSIVDQVKANKEVGERYMRYMTLEEYAKKEADYMYSRIYKEKYADAFKKLDDWRDELTGVANRLEGEKQELEGEKQELESEKQELESEKQELENEKQELEERKRQLEELLQNEGLIAGIITVGKNMGVDNERIIEMLVNECNLSKEKAREMLEGNL